MWYAAKSAHASISHKGNAALDVVLFLPLALFFLFVVTDGGLTLIEQAQLRDSIRAGLHAEYASEIPLTLTADLDQSGSAVNRTAAVALAQHLADELNSRINPDPQSSSRRGVEVSIFAIEVDQQSGKLKLNTLERVATEFQPGNGFPPSSIITDYPYVSSENYLEQNLGQARDQGASFSQPLGPVYLSSGELDLTKRFAGRTLLVYVDVRAVVSGVNAAFAESALGRFYGFQLQHLQPLRLAGN